MPETLGGADKSMNDRIFTAALSVPELAALGVRRIGIGGSLARAVFAFVRTAALEMRDRGAFGYAGDQMPEVELNALMRRAG